MSLADELLADLEEAAGEEDEAEGSEGGEEPPIEDVREEPEPLEAAESVRILGPVEAAPEYRVIVDANNLTVEIENELSSSCRRRSWGASRGFGAVFQGCFLGFLGSPSPNFPFFTPKCRQQLSEEELGQFLGQFLGYFSAVFWVFWVFGGVFWGFWGPRARISRFSPQIRQQLSEEELGRIEDACDMALALSGAKLRIYEYVESRMSFIAPNLSLILGASTAAKIMGVAGGLTPLSKLPACNILLLGAQRRTLSGFSSTSVLPHTGFIYHSDIVQSLPPDLRRKAARLVAAKCTLAARVDSFHESQDGKVGYELKEEIERKFDKWQEYRKMKERLGLTEIRKQANRMSFGEIEEDAYQEDLGFSLGHLGKSGSGRVRQTQVNEATKARISKTLQRTLQKQSVVYGGKSTIRDRSSGTASSVAFTPLQGLEIVNPQAAEKKVAEANQKYFSSMAEFLKVKGEKSGVPTPP
ncbi:U4/U6 small nuclear ribonucleoprotein Prp31-like [Malurus melanocephalus]|uniref:U4/U6 small nuclear ribonucleoprotein Prp31-like n=1 Tax=Malurus melanocephalus TaxID=175006 RepID=UPI0025478C28|nr:U4/U6 small nuclear ribonucleoprotein Prp31-like [Malurus melanocephalus]